MKNLQWLGACVLALTTFVAAHAQNPESEPKALKLKADETASPASSSASVTDQVLAPSNASPNSEQLDTRLKALEAQLTLILDGLNKANAEVVRKKDVEELIDAKLKERKPQPKLLDVNDPLKVIPPKSSEQSNAGIIRQLDDIQKQLSELRADVSTLAEDKKITPTQPNKNPGPRSGVIVIRNRTGETQSFIVEDKEWRISGDSLWYEIPVTLAGMQDSLWGQVWHDKPRIREFKNVNGRLESRVDITLQPVRLPSY